MHVISKKFFSHSHFVQCLLLYAFIKDEHHERSFMLILKLHFNLLTKEQKCLLNMDYLTSTPTSQIEILPPGHLDRQNWQNALFSYLICIHSNVSIFKERNIVLAQHIQTKEKQKIMTYPRGHEIYNFVKALFNLSKYAIDFKAVSAEEKEICIHHIHKHYMILPQSQNPYHSPTHTLSYLFLFCSD